MELSKKGEREKKKYIYRERRLCEEKDKGQGKMTIVSAQGLAVNLRLTTAHGFQGCKRR
jgi:hypothetical protein